MSRWNRCTSIFLLAGIVGTMVACADGALVAPTNELDLAAASTKVTDGTRCLPDSKLIGRIHLVATDASDSWWTLTRNGFDAAGIVNYQGTLEGFFGQPFVSLGEAKQFLVDQVKPLDSNANGYVCAYEIRGTRAFIGDPQYAHYFFKVRDDN